MPIIGDVLNKKSTITSNTENSTSNAQNNLEAVKEAKKKNTQTENNSGYILSEQKLNEPTQQPDQYYTVNDSSTVSGKSSTAEYLRNQEQIRENKRKKWESTLQNNSMQGSKIISALKKRAEEVSPFYQKYIRDADLEVNKENFKVTISNESWNYIGSKYKEVLDNEGQEAADQYLNVAIRDEVAKQMPTSRIVQNAVLGALNGAEGAIHSLLAFFEGGIDMATGKYKSDDKLSNMQNYLTAAVTSKSMERSKLAHAGITTWIGGLGELLGDDKTRRKKESYKKYGITGTEILKSSKEEGEYLNSKVVGDSFASLAFTVMSMGEGSAVKWGIDKGVKYAGKQAMKTARKALEKGAREEAKKALKKAVLTKTIGAYASAIAVPGVSGTLEGLDNASETYNAALENSTQIVNSKHVTKVLNEVEKILNTCEQQQQPDGSIVYFKNGRAVDVNALIAEVDAKYNDIKEESLHQARIDASTAATHDFYVNSLINGCANATLKATIFSGKAAEALSKTRAYKWVHPSFDRLYKRVNGRITVTPYMSKMSKARYVLAEPWGEAVEEFSQTVSSNTFQDVAENNIEKFTINKYFGDGTAQLGETMEGDYSTFLSSLGKNLMSKEARQSAVMGALGSIIGTPSFARRSTNAQGKSGIFVKGQGESTFDMIRRMTPWRSGAFGSWNELKKEEDDAKDLCLAIENFLNSSKNKRVLDGLNGTAAFIKDMENAAQRNDQHDYRNSAHGKLIELGMILDALEGTEYREAVMDGLERVLGVKAGTAEAQELIEQAKADNDGAFTNMSDDAIFNTLKENAKKIKESVEDVQKKLKKADNLLEFANMDTKQAYVYGEMMIDNMVKRADTMDNEIKDFIRENISDTTPSIGMPTTEKGREAVIKYGDKRGIIKEAERLEKVADSQVESLRKQEKEIEERKKKHKKLVRSGKKEEARVSQQELGLMIALHEQAKTNLKKMKTTAKELRETAEEVSEDVVLSKSDILRLPAQDRARFILNGTKKLYDSRHKKVSQNPNEINETTESTEDKFKSPYSAKQQAVIDELVQDFSKTEGGMDFYEKLIDLGRLDAGIKKLTEQKINLLTNPEAMDHFAYNARNAARKANLAYRAEKIASIEDAAELSTELDKIRDELSDNDFNYFMSEMRKYNSETFKEVQKSRIKLGNFFEKLKYNPEFRKLDEEEQEALFEALAYLSDNNVDYTNVNEGVAALSAITETGYAFDEWLDRREKGSGEETRKEDRLPLEDVIQIYKDIINQYNKDNAFQDRSDKKSEVVETADTGKPAERVTPNEGSEKKETDENPDKKPGGVFDFASDSAEEAARLGMKADGVDPNATDDKGIPINVDAAGMQSLNISAIRQKYPNSAIVQYYDKYGIEQFLQGDFFIENPDAPIYFMIDSSLEDGVKNSMGSSYSNNDAPLVAVIEHPDGGIIIGEKHYQPVAVMPSSGRNTMGNNRVTAVRNAALKVERNQLATTEQGTVIQTKKISVDGKKIESIEVGQPNKSVSTLIEEQLTPEDREKAKEDKSIWKKAIKAFLEKLEVVQKDKQGKSYKMLYFVDNNGNNGVVKLPILVTKLEDCKDIHTGKNFFDELRNNELEALHANSRIERFVETLKKFNQEFQEFRTNNPIIFGADGKYIPEVQKKLEEMVDKYAKELGRQLSPVNASYKYYPIYNPETKGFKLLLANKADPTVAPIEVISDMTQAPTDATMMNALSALMLEEGKPRMLGEFNFMKYQVDYPTVGTKFSENQLAAKEIETALNDGMLETSAQSLQNPMTTLTIDSPFTKEGVYKTQVTVANPDNANTNGGPSDGKINTSAGQVNPITGLPDNPAPEPKDDSHVSEGLKRAEEVKEKILSDSEELELTEDEKFYVDKQKKQHVRVTTLLQSADGQHVFGFKNFIKNGGEKKSTFNIGQSGNSLYTTLLKTISSTVTLGTKEYAAKNNIEETFKSILPQVQSFFASTQTLREHIGVELSSEFLPNNLKELLDKDINLFSKENEDTLNDFVFYTVAYPLISKVLDANPELVAKFRKAVGAQDISETFSEEYGYVTPFGRAWAKYLSEHESPFTLPSTNIGTGVDDFVRDTFEGTEGSEEDFAKNYPNATKEEYAKFHKQVDNFKKSLEAKGLHVIPKGVTVSGEVEVIGEDGKKKTISVAGTLDLLAYDDYGNFYIYDMKTHRSGVSDKYDKWELQLSLYKKLLEQKYGINVTQLAIIPIKTSYAEPVGYGVDDSNHVDYKQGPNNQLINGKNNNEFRGATFELEPEIILNFKDPVIREENLNTEEKSLLNTQLDEAAAQQPTQPTIEGTPQEGSEESPSEEESKPQQQGESGEIENVRLGSGLDDLFGDYQSSETMSNNENREEEQTSNGSLFFGSCKKVLRNEDGYWENPMESGVTYSSKEILDLYQKQHPNLPESYYRLANAVFACCNSLGVKFVRDDSLRGVNGVYSQDTNTIRYSGTLQNNTLLHEAIHAVTSYYINYEEQELGELPTRIKEAIDQLKYCYNVMREIYFRNEDGTTLTPEQEEERLLIIRKSPSYAGLASFKEFIAELSRPEFLATIKRFDKKYNTEKYSKRSFFQRIVDSVMQMIGLKQSKEESNKKIADTAYGALRTIIENPNKEIAEKTETAFKGLRLWRKAFNAATDQISINQQQAEKLEGRYGTHSAVGYTRNVQEGNLLRKGSVIAVLKDGKEFAMAVVINNPIIEDGKEKCDLRLVHPNEFVSGEAKVEFDTITTPNGSTMEIRPRLQMPDYKNMRFTPSRLVWGIFNNFKDDEGNPLNLAATMEVLSQHYSETEWNEMLDEEKEHELHCKGVFDY